MYCSSYLCVVLLVISLVRPPLIPLGTALCIYFFVYVIISLCIVGIYFYSYLCVYCFICYSFFLALVRYACMYLFVCVSLFRILLFL